MGGIFAIIITTLHVASLGVEKSALDPLCCIQSRTTVHFLIIFPAEAPPTSDASLRNITVRDILILLRARFSLVVVQANSVASHTPRVAIILELLRVTVVESEPAVPPASLRSKSAPEASDATA